MNDGSVALKKLSERVLGKGSELPLAMLLELLVPVKKLRETTASFGLSPKGGFRIDKAPAHVLAPMLAELREPKQLDTVLQLLLSSKSPSVAESPASADEAAASEPVVSETAVLANLRVAELARARDELERAREAATRARERESDLSRRLQRAEQEVTLLRRELAYRSSSVAPTPEPAGADAEWMQRVRDLETEREDLLASDETLRRQLAGNQSRLRELEATVAELDALLPKGKRRRKPQSEPEPESGDRRFLLPRFLPSFYKSLEGKERKSVARAFAAILQFCTEGHAYPGLEVKQLGGQDTWSLRASLGLRVYFRQLPDGEIELLELGNREDQHTTLRRLKER
jgi:hypothetical protein